MPIKGGVMTDQERAFVSHVATTGDPVYAAAIAGYKHPSRRAYHNLTKPELQTEIRKQQLARLHNDVLPMAINVLRAALDLDHAGVPWGSRVTAAKIVTDRVFNDAQTGANKDMADMTADELKERMAQLQGRLAEMAKPIVDASAEPVDDGAFE
jgi:phage terminase small subunit